MKLKSLSGEAGIDKSVFVPIMPIPLLEGIKGFENREFVTTAGVASLQNCEEIAALFILRINRENGLRSLDRVEVVG